MADTDPSSTAPATSPEGPSTEGTSEGAATPETSAPPTPDLASEIAALKQELAATKQQSQQSQSYLQMLAAQLQAQATAALSEDPKDAKARLREELDQDPESALDKLLAMRLGPIMREQSLSQAKLAEAEAARQLDAEGWGDEYRALKGKVEAFMTDIPVDRQTSADAWRTAFQLQLLQSGQFDDVALRRAQKRIEKERSMASEGASPTRAAPKGPAPLTTEEKRMARAFGMTEDEFQQEKQKLEG